MDTVTTMRDIALYSLIALLIVSCTRQAQIPTAPEEQPVFVLPTPMGKSESTASARGVSNALNVILEKAEQYKQQGLYTQAASTLERGIKIESDSALLWQKLAEIKLLQGNYNQAEQLARKSNSLAATDQLHQLNLQIIEQARNKQRAK